MPDPAVGRLLRLLPWVLFSALPAFFPPLISSGSSGINPLRNTRAGHFEVSLKSFCCRRRFPSMSLSRARAPTTFTSHIRHAYLGGYRYSQPSGPPAASVQLVQLGLHGQCKCSSNITAAVVVCRHKCTSKSRIPYTADLDASRPSSSSPEAVLALPETCTDAIPLWHWHCTVLHCTALDYLQLLLYLAQPAQYTKFPTLKDPASRRLPIRFCAAQWSFLCYVDGSVRPRNAIAARLCPLTRQIAPDISSVSLSRRSASHY